MKISDFAAKHGITAKMLRHYDEIGLLKPVSIDPVNGYRVYEEGQDKVVKWILVLKALVKLSFYLTMRLIKIFF